MFKKIKLEDMLPPENVKLEDLGELFNDMFSYLKDNEEVKSILDFINEITKQVENPKIRDLKIDRNCLDIFLIEGFESEKDFILKVIFSLNKEERNFYKLKPIPHIINDEQTFIKEVIKNGDPFIIKLDEDYYYVKQKKNRLVFSYGKNNFKTLRYNGKTSVSKIKGFLETLPKSNYRGLDDIIEDKKLNINEEKRNKIPYFDKNIFLKNIADDIDMDLIKSISFKYIPEIGMHIVTIETNSEYDGVNYYFKEYKKNYMKFSNDKLKIIVY